MIQKLKKNLSSIAFKLFLSFWLITICSIALTRFVSSQLEQDSTIIPINQKDVSELVHLAKRLERKQPKNLKKALSRFSQFGGAHLALKDLSNQRILLGRKRHFHVISSYLEKNELSHHTSVQFPFARLTGPEKINIKGKSYQLFLVSHTRPPAFGSVFMQLPYWARFIIPLLVSITLCWLLARTLTKPLIAVKDAALNFGNGNYGVRVSKASKRQDEIGEMANSFNLMADKLEANIQANQRLLADVSHELRSPMTRLQIALGLIQKSNTNNDKVEQYIERCEREVSRLDTMISNILSLSRLENRFQQAPMETLALTKLLTTATDDAEYLANEKAITIQLTGQTDITVYGNEALLLSAIHNILTNAIKYSPTSSSIELDSQCSSDKIKIAIADAGTGVPEEQLDKLFDAFYRVSEARDRESGGTGLGLAIAKQAVEQHQGKIYAQNNLQGGLTVVIEIPRNI